MDKPMMLITSTWGSQKTFRLIPLDNNAPYSEGIYDPDTKVLALIGKEKKETLQMVPKLTPLGDPEILKIGKRPGGKDYAEERKLMETYYEYYVEEQAEIEYIVDQLCSNTDGFNYKKYFTVPEEPAKSNIIV